MAKGIFSKLCIVASVLLLAASWGPVGRIRAAGDAVLELTPASGTYNVGDYITVDLKVSSASLGAGYYAVGANVQYSSNLEYETYNLETQPASYFVEVSEPTASGNKVHISAYNSTPASPGLDITNPKQVVRMRFRVVSGTSATLSILNSSDYAGGGSEVDSGQVLGGDNLLNSVVNGTYTINAPATPTPEVSPTPTPPTPTPPTPTPEVTVDPNMPVIGEPTVSVTERGATIGWTTSNIESSTRLFYAVKETSSDYAWSTVEKDTDTRVKEHSVTIANLVPCTTYYYAPYSKSEAGLEKLASGYKFTTAGCVGTINRTGITSISKDAGGTSSVMNGTVGLSMVAPKDFSTDDLVFQLMNVDRESTLKTTSTPSGQYIVGGHLYELHALKDASTLVSTFGQPISITINYSDADIKGISEGRLSVMQWDEGQGWTAPTGGCVVTAASNKVTCQTNHFSVFALVSPEANAVTTTSTGTLPNTGENVSYLMFAALAVLGGMGAVAGFKLRRR